MAYLLLCAVVWMAIAFLIGLISALREGRRFDHIAAVVSYITYSIPTFWLAILLISLFSVALGLFPVSGMTDTRTSPAFGSAAYWEYAGANPLLAIAGLLHHLVLPVATLAIVSFAGDARVIRGSVIESLRGEYVRTARAKGIDERRVLLRHVLRNSLIPFVTSVGIMTGYLLGGAIVVEQVFAIPGLGRLILGAIAERNYPLLQATILVVTSGFVVVNFAVDLLYTAIDPRVRA